ncbi:MAG: hypothetical protein R3B06_22505 [Kofleriaceae bacterium]
MPAATKRTGAASGGSAGRSASGSATITSPAPAPIASRATRSRIDMPPSGQRATAACSAKATKADGTRAA